MVAFKRLLQLNENGPTLIPLILYGEVIYFKRMFLRVSAQQFLLSLLRHLQRIIQTGINY